jgi:hypothetical protein
MNGADNRITITDIDIPFGRMVMIFVKVVLASIPAMILIYLILGAIALGISLLFGLPGMWHTTVKA